MSRGQKPGQAQRLSPPGLAAWSGMARLLVRGVRAQASSTRLTSRSLLAKDVSVSKKGYISPTRMTQVPSLPVHMSESRHSDKCARHV